MSESGTTLRFPSVASLFVEARCGDTVLSTATGFVVDGNTGPAFITNRHVVSGADQNTRMVLSKSGAVPDNICIYHHSKGKPGTWARVLMPLFDDDQMPLWYEHPSLGAEADIVGLALGDLGGVDVYKYDPLNRGVRSPEIGPADIVSVVGFPFGLSAGGRLPIWATGFVASEPAIDLDGRPLFLIDCRSRKGQSGSAVVAHRKAGEVFYEGGKLRWYSDPTTTLLGVYSGRVNEQSDLGFVWKSSAIWELVQAIP